MKSLYPIFVSILSKIRTLSKIKKCRSVNMMTSKWKIKNNRSIVFKIRKILPLLSKEKRKVFQDLTVKINFKQ